MAAVIGRISSPRFVGRADELTALQRAVSAALEGAGSVVLVAGEPGIGKSRMIGELVGRLKCSGVSVLVGECPPLGDGELPFAPIVGVLRALVRQRGTDELDELSDRARGELAHLLPELAQTRAPPPGHPPSEGSQARLFEQLLAVLVAAARTAPLVLVIEDLHWADRSTRDFLTFLVRAARPEPLGVVGTYRSDEVHGRRHPVRPFVHELERSGQATRIELMPFTRVELREQIEAILDAVPEPGLIDRLLERSEGNPFFAEELLASASTDAVLPETLRDALLWRLDGRPASVQDVLRIAAVAGRTVDHGLLSAVAGLSEDELTVALRDAVDSYVLAHDLESSGYSFRHALLREAIYADLLPGQRRKLHLTLARTLGEHPELAGKGATAAAELAYHWYQAGELAEALAASVTAGMAAEEIRALSEALLHYERALEAWDRLGEGVQRAPLDRCEVTRRAVDSARSTGSQERAVELARELVELIDEHEDPAGAAVAHARLGQALWLAGHGENDSLFEYRRAVRLMPTEPPTSELAFVLASEAQMLLLCSRFAESDARSAQALEIAADVGSAELEAHVLNTSCANSTAAGEFDRAVASAERARAIATRLGSVEEIGRSYVNGSDALDHSGRLQESIALAREGIEVAHELGVECRFGDFLRSEVAGRLLHTGGWAEAEELLDEVGDRSPTGLVAVIALQFLGQLNAERGRLEAARRSLKAADELLSRPGGSVWVGPITEGLATVELWSGRPRAAAAVIAECLEELDGREHIFYTARLYELGIRACADLAAASATDVALLEEQRAIADGLLARLNSLIAMLTGTVPPRVAATRAACAAERSRVGGVGDPVLWAQTQRLWDEYGERYLAACARWRRAAALLGAGGERREAERLIRDAHAVATELEARPLSEELEALAQRARIELRSAGDRNGGGPDSGALALDLTPREIEVLKMVAAGATNREIATELYISRKTASAHVSHILSKLSVPNRTAAAATARRMGIGGDG